MPSLGRALDALAEVFRALDVSWYVFGAQALAVRAAARATQDIDITVDGSGVSADRLTKLLLDSGFEHRHPDLVGELLRDGRVLVLRHVEGGMDVDLVLSGPGLEHGFLARSTTEVLDGVRVPVASATDLVVMKVLSGRGKDLDDVVSLITAGQVDLSLAEDLLGQLDAALGQSDLVPTLHRAAASARLD